MGVIRLPVLWTLSLLLFLAAAEATWASDWTFGPPPIAGPQRSKPRKLGPAAGNVATRGNRQVSFDAPATLQDEPVEDSDRLQSRATSRPSPQTTRQSPLSPLEEMQADDNELLPIAMPDDGGDNPLVPFTPPAPTASSGKWYSRGCWYVEQEVTFMYRSERKGTNLAYDFTLNGPTQSSLRAQLATSRDLSFAPGARMTIGTFLGRDVQNRDGKVEFTFFGLNNFSSARGLTSLQPNNLASFFDPTFSLGGFSRSNHEEYSYRSSFNSYEVNVLLARRSGRDQMVLTRDGGWVRTLSPSILPTFFAGMRVVTVNESFNWLSTGTNPATTFGQYNVRTHNTLCGFQLGSDFQYQQSEWRAGVRLKGGPFLNFADQSSIVRIIDTTVVSPSPNRDVSNQATPVSLLGEVNVHGAYLFRPNMALRVSYNIIGLTDVAVADKQLTFTQLNPAKLSTTHGLMYQGFTAGFEFYW